MVPAADILSHAGIRGHSSVNGVYSTSWKHQHAHVQIVFGVLTHEPL